MVRRRFKTGRRGDKETGRICWNALLANLFVSKSPCLLVCSLQHREAAAVAFAAEALVELALLGFVAAVDDDLVQLE
jgi:hypothetical protein